MIHLIFGEYSRNSPDLGVSGGLIAGSVVAGYVFGYKPARRDCDSRGSQREN